MKKVKGVLLAFALTLTLFAPWLIRNAATTGNPVFPLATSIFGASHWDEQSELRWVRGHSPTHHPPVPVPPGYSPRVESEPSRGAMFLDHFLLNERLGPALLVLGLLGIVLVFAPHQRVFPGTLVLLLLLQFIVWILFTRSMPDRFIVCAIVPLALLAGNLLGFAFGIQGGKYRKHVTALFTLGVLLHIGISVHRFNALNGIVGYRPYSGKELANAMYPMRHAWELPDTSRILLVGEAKAFYYPQNTIYATAFDENPLETILQNNPNPSAVQEALKERGITHVWVNWSELSRLARTYGYPAELVGELLTRNRRDASNPFRQAGLVPLHHLESRYGPRVTVYQVPEP